MLSRYHLVSISGIVLLGVAANYVFPDFRFPIPWTVIFLLLAGALCSSFYAFMGAAEFSSPTVLGENMRFSRFPQAFRLVYDGEMWWAGIPAKGWIYRQTFVNSAGNPALLLLPAQLLEAKNETYMVARARFYRISKRAVAVLSRKRTFARLFKEMEVGQKDDKTEVFLGFYSGSLHPDATHIRTQNDLNAYARSLSTDEIEYGRNVNDLKARLSGELNMWKRIQGSEPAQIVIRRGNEEERK